MLTFILDFSKAYNRLHYFKEKKKQHPVSLPLDMMMGEMGWKNPGFLLCLILELQRLGQILYCCAIQLLCLTI